MKIESRTLLKVVGIIGVATGIIAIGLRVYEKISDFMADWKYVMTDVSNARVDSKTALRIEGVLSDDIDEIKEKIRSIEDSLNNRG